MGINLDLLEPRTPEKQALVITLDTQLSGMRYALIRSGVQARLVLLTDTPHVTKHMPSQISQRIIAVQHGLKRHTRKTVFVNCKTCSFNVIQLRLQQVFLKSWSASKVFLEYCNVILFKIDQFAYLV